MEKVYYDEEGGIRWMPDGDEDISWPWIKEALPSINLTKVKISPRLTSPKLKFYLNQPNQGYNFLSINLTKVVILPFFTLVHNCF